MEAGGDVPIKPKLELMSWFLKQEKILEAQLGASSLGRVRDLLRVMSGREEPQYANLQAPYTYFMPSLRASPFHHTEPFRLTKILESAHADIVQELQQLLHRPDTQKDFEAYEGDGLPDERGGMVDGTADTWTVYYFYHNFEPIEEHLQAAPKTAAILHELRKELLFGMVCFSVLRPGAEILAHTGPSNMRLTAHLGLIGCEGTTVRVGGQERSYENGKVIIFDDSFVHGVRHNGTQLRVTLMMDLWHPDLTKEEIAAFQQLMQNSIGEINQIQFFHSLGILKGPHGL